jgi:hypothetical protein
VDILERSLFKMARIEQKSVKSKNLVNKILLWCAVGFLAAVLVASIVILILWLVGDKEEETEFVEKFESAEIITFEELEEMLDEEGKYSELLEKNQNVYVYVYTPDYEANETASKLHDKVLETVNAYNEVKDASGNEYAFFVINVTAEENVEYLEENASSFVSGLGTEYPYLVEFEIGEDDNKVTGYNNILRALKDIIINLK